MKRKVKRKQLTEAGVPSVDIPTEVSWCHGALGSSKRIVLRSEYGKNRTKALASFVVYAVATGKSAVYVTESQVLDAYAATFERDMSAWFRILFAEVLVIDGLDGNCMRRNLSTGIFLCLEERLREDRYMVIGTKLQSTELFDMYGDGVCCLLREYFEEREDFDK